MSEKKNLNKQNTYNKHNSFFSFSSINKEFNEDKITKKINTLHKSKIGLERINAKDHSILDTAVNDLNLNVNEKNKNNFSLSKNVIDEILSLKENEILRYLVFRYKYEIFPIIKRIDSYPPYLQIEPSSICNYRCVFCFETDKTFTNKKNGFMGKMDKNLFKSIIDQIEGNIEFISLASRGEPLANPDIPEMLEYCSNKFLNLKINTNASLLDEKKIHAILAGGVKTLVFSADAADEKLYSELRVNGNLKKVLKNIEKFQNIKEKKYSKNSIITRVSGVKFNDKQNFDEMINLWSGLVDQVAFVDYNPWENSYEKTSNDIKEPCSDLWRRMFIWWDGKINPCDVDYKSLLSVGNIKENNISNLWLSEEYNRYREEHLNFNRKKIKPCNSCTVV